MITVPPPCLTLGRDRTWQTLRVQVQGALQWRWWLRDSPARVQSEALRVHITDTLKMNLLSFPTQTLTWARANKTWLLDSGLRNTRIRAWRFVRHRWRRQRGEKAKGQAVLEDVPFVHPPLPQSKLAGGRYRPRPAPLVSDQRHSFRSEGNNRLPLPWKSWSVKIYKLCPGMFVSTLFTVEKQLTEKHLNIPQESQGQQCDPGLTDFPLRRTDTPRGGVAAGRKNQRSGLR